MGAIASVVSGPGFASKPRAPMRVFCNPVAMTPARAKQRTTSKVVADKPGCVPLKEVYEWAVQLRPTSWNQIEAEFLRAMELFDHNVATGVADMGDLQNGKGDFFNDLLALLLEQCAGVQLCSRGAVPGLIFPRHNLDVTYPNEGAVEFMLEAKAVGTPKHPGSPKQKAHGRPGAADLDKRVKEIAFKAIDLKAEFARLQTQQGHGAQGGAVGGDLTTWLHSVKPRSYLFVSARVVNDRDFERVMYFANVAQQVVDAVGVFCFRPDATDPTKYVPCKVTSTAFELERVLFRASQNLVAIKNAGRAQP